MQAMHGKRTQQGWKVQPQQGFDEAMWEGRAYHTAGPFSKPKWLKQSRSKRDEKKYIYIIYIYTLYIHVAVGQNRDTLVDDRE